MATATATSTIAAVTNQDRTTSFHPFTTAWTEPPGCKSIFMALTTSDSFALTAYAPEYGMSVNTSATCLPSEFTKYTSRAGKTQNLLGPFRCPGGWREATTTARSSYTLTYCCPSGYGQLPNIAENPGGGWGTCISSLNLYDHFTWAYKDGNDWVLTTNGSDTTSDSTGRVEYRTVVAHPFVMGYNTAPMTNTAEATAASADDASSSASSGLSTGAKAGIGVGVSLGVIAIIAGLGFFYFLGKKRRDRSQNADEDSEKNGESDRDAAKSTELGGSEPLELDSKDGPAPMPLEMQSKGDAPELQGDEGLRQELEGVNSLPPVELEAGDSGDQVIGRDTEGKDLDTKDHAHVLGHEEDAENDTKKGPT